MSVLLPLLTHALLTTKSGAVLLSHMLLTTKSGAVLLSHMLLTTKSGGVLSCHRLLTTKSGGVLLSHMLLTTKSGGVLSRHMLLTTKSGAVLSRHIHAANYALICTKYLLLKYKGQPIDSHQTVLDFTLGHMFNNTGRAPLHIPNDTYGCPP